MELQREEESRDSFLKLSTENYFGIVLFAEKMISVEQDESLKTIQQINMHEGISQFIKKNRSGNPRYSMKTFIPEVNFNSISLKKLQQFKDGQQLSSYGDLQLPLFEKSQLLNDSIQHYQYIIQSKDYKLDFESFLNKNHQKITKEILIQEQISSRSELQRAGSGAGQEINALQEQRNGEEEQTATEKAKDEGEKMTKDETTLIQRSSREVEFIIKQVFESEEDFRKYCEIVQAAGVTLVQAWNAGVSQENLNNFQRLIENQQFYQLWIKCLEQYRVLGQFEILQPDGYQQMSYLMNLILTKFSLLKDTLYIKNLLLLSQTFYKRQEIQEEGQSQAKKLKIYLQSNLLINPVWKCLDFWESLILLNVYKAIYDQNKLLGSRSQSLSSSERQNNQRNVFFG